MTERYYGGGMESQLGINLNLFFLFIVKVEFQKKDIVPVYWNLKAVTFVEVRWYTYFVRQTNLFNFIILV